MARAEPPLRALAEDSLRVQAGDAVFARGERYWRDGAVELLHDEGKQARFEVQGSDRYSVLLQLGRSGVDGECTCPHAADGHFCKHMVAAALLWRQSLLGEAEPAPAAAPTQQRVAKALQTRAANAKALSDFLAQQPAAELARRLWQRAQQDRDLMAEIKGWAAAAAATADPRALRRAVDELLKISSRVYLEPREVRAWAGRAAQAAQLLRQALPQQGAEVRSIVESALRQAQRVQDRAYDDPGAVEDVITLLIDVLADALRAAPPPAAWADHLLQRMQDEGGEPWQAPQVLEAAGPEVARLYSKRLAELWSRLAPLPTGDESKLSSKAADRRWQQEQERSRLRHWMLQDLQRQGDPRALFSFMKSSAVGVHEHVQLIQWCEAHGRAREALQLAQAACKQFNNDKRLEDLLLAAYERDGWDDEALAIHRRRFAQTPAPDLYIPLVAAARRAKADLAALRTWAHETAAARELAELQRAAELLRRYAFMRPPGTQAARDVSWRAGLHVLDGELDAALALVQPPHTCDPRLLETLADRLPAARKAEAFALLKRCFDFEMQRAKTPYTEALRLARKAATRLSAAHRRDWIEALRSTHRAKRNFVAGLPEGA
jgi:uncharacterized Zn finger protein